MVLMILLYGNGNTIHGTCGTTIVHYYGTIYGTVRIIPWRYVSVMEVRGNFFSQRVVSEWNSLPEYVALATSVV